ncbi:MAG: LysR family transcriptional regulator [Oscillospiraceae bacterium]|nr:LysR family transcriptional regulator [Oscillospiraceae bacterium]
MNIYEQNFDLNLYKTFCVVAETKSISKAAEVLFVSQQAVSYSIKQLEYALGGKLFFRTPKGVVLTPEAEKLYFQVYESLNNIIMGQEIFTEDKELKAGHIYIGCNASLFDVCIYKYVASFHKTYPNVEIHVVSKPSNDLFKMLRNHDLDLVAKKFTSEDSTDPQFSVKMFSEINNCFIGNKDYKFLAEKKQVSLEELNQYPLLLPNKDSYERRYLEEDFRKKNLELKPLMDFTSHGPIIKFVKEGFGIGHAIKEQVEEDLKAGILFQIPVEGVTFTDNIGMIYDEKYLTFAADKFISSL